MTLKHLLFYYVRAESLYMRIRYLLLILIHFFIAVTSSTAQSVIDTRSLSDKNDWNISSSISFISDSAGYDLKKVTALPLSQWQLNEKQFTFHKGISPHGYWIRFAISEGISVNQTYYVQLSNKGLNEAELFIATNGSYKSLGRTGDHYPFSQRPYPSPYFTYPVTIHKNDTVTCYLYVNKKDENLNVKLRLLPEAVLKQKETTTTAYLGFFCGVLLMAFIVSVIMLFIFKDPLSFWYSIYIALVANLLLTYEGFDFQWLYPNHPFYTSISRFMASTVTLGMMVYVMQLYCNQKASNSRFFYAAEIFKISLFIMVPITLIVYAYFPTTTIKKIHFIFFLVQQLGGIALIFISSIEKMLQRYKPAAFYLSAVILLLYSSITAMLLELGKINRNADTPNLLQWSFVLEVILISIGILYKYKLVQQTNQTLSSELADLKLSSIKQLLQTQQQEQVRIAEDLHDLLGAQLAALKFKVAGSQTPENEKTEISSVIDSLSRSTRTIAHNLRPSELHQHDLSHVIERYLQGLNAEQSIQFDFIQNGAQKNLGPELELTIYKIIMELITNILKHSEATEAVVQLSFHENNLELIVEDNGKGIESSKNEGMGLINVRKRVAQSKGDLHIDSQPGNTTFIISFLYNNHVL